MFTAAYRQRRFERLIAAHDGVGAKYDLADAINSALRQLRREGLR